MSGHFLLISTYFNKSHLSAEEIELATRLFHVNLDQWGVHLECHTRFFLLLLMKFILLNLFVGIAISRKGDYNCALDKIF